MKRMKLLFLSAGMILPLLSGCNLFKFNNQSESEKGGTSQNSDTSQGDGTQKEIFKIENPKYDCPVRASKDDVVASDLFNLKNKVSISIDIDRSELQKLEEDMDYDAGNKPETYRLAKKVTISLKNGNNTFTWELNNVGIRQKGNTSREHIFLDNSDVRNQNHFKLSFDETFTSTKKYDSTFISENSHAENKDREFLGLTGLDIKWDKNDDQTHLKEIYSNMALRSAGIIAQRVGLSTMKMNYDDNKTADFGLCYIYEQTSKDLIKNALSSDQIFINMQTWDEEKKGAYGEEGKKYGELYKVSYGRGSGSNSGGDLTTDSLRNGDAIGVKTDIRGYNYPAYERKTHKDDNYHDEAFKNVISVLNKNNASYSEISQVVDLEYFAMEEAVMYFLGNPDSFRYNYNNYMAYLRRTDQKMVIIPIDNDRNLGTGNGWTDGMNFVMSNDATPMSRVVKFGEQRNPLFKKTILSNSDNQAKTDYKNCLELVKNSAWVKKETFANYFNILKETYTGLATFNLAGGTDNVSFETYMNKKMELYGKKEGSSTSETSEPETSSQTEALFPADRVYYVTGSFNQWGSYPDSQKDWYRLVPQQNGTFVCYFNVETAYEENKIEIKINAGQTDWSYEYYYENGCFKKGPGGDNKGLVVDGPIGSLVKLVVWIETGEAFATVDEAGRGLYFSDAAYVDDCLGVLTSANNYNIIPCTKATDEPTFEAIIPLTTDVGETISLTIFDSSTNGFLKPVPYPDDSYGDNVYNLKFYATFVDGQAEIPTNGALFIKVAIVVLNSMCVITYNTGE